MDELIFTLANKKNIVTHDLQYFVVLISIIKSNGQRKLFLLSE